MLSNESSFPFLSGVSEPRSTTTSSCTKFVGTCWDSEVRLELREEGGSITGDASVGDGRNFVVVGQRTLGGYDLVFGKNYGEFPLSLTWEANGRILSGCDLELGSLAVLEKVEDERWNSPADELPLHDGEVELVHVAKRGMLSRDQRTPYYSQDSQAPNNEGVSIADQGSYLRQAARAMYWITAQSTRAWDYIYNYWRCGCSRIILFAILLIEIILLVLALVRPKAIFILHAGLLGILFGIQAYFAIMPLKRSKDTLPLRSRFRYIFLLTSLTLGLMLVTLILRSRMKKAACVESKYFYYYDDPNDKHNKDPDDRNKNYFKQYGLAELGTLTVCLFVVTGIGIACFLQTHPPSWYCRASAMGIVMMWLHTYCQSFRLVLLLHCVPELLVAFFTALDTTSDILVFFWISLLMRKRLKALTKQLFATDAAYMKRRLLFSRIYFYVLSFAYGLAKASSLISNADGDADSRFFGIPLPGPVYLYGTCSGMLLLALIRATRMFAGAVSVLQAEAKETCGAARAQCLWACDILVVQRNGVVATIASSGIYVAGLTLKRFGKLPGVRHLGLDFNKGLERLIFSAACQVLYIVINAICVASVSGIFGVKHMVDDDVLSGPSPQKKQLVAQPKEADWMDKVHDLATRGIVLSDLLDFYDSLGTSVMPSYDPMISTTNDIVRGAIIPLSRDLEPNGGGRALASVWNKDRPIIPQKMVTHSWGNLFCHLVCAVIADALKVQSGEGYARIGRILSEPGGMQLIRKDLKSTMALRNTYWICAFSVNQHAGICGGFGPPPPRGSPERFAWEEKKCDSVTRKEFHLCTCQQEKLFTGKDCEMNKFDDMMVHLSSIIPNFSQVVAVDEDFGLFERAWCVAELVEADSCGLSQNMLIHSEDSLDNHYHRLKHLDVRECQASRKEDKDEILAKIQDLESFNAQLQHLIFGSEGLFKSFSDGINLSATAGRIVKRIMKRATLKGAPNRANVIADRTARARASTRMNAKSSMRMRAMTAMTANRSQSSRTGSD